MLKASAGVIILVIITLTAVVFLWIDVNKPNYAFFIDVPFHHWASEAIDTLYRSGISGGCSLDPPLYCPDEPVTRSQMALLIERSLNGATWTPPPATGIFSDVRLTHWAVNWVEALYRNGLTQGCTPGPDLHFCPDDPVTRSQIAVILLKAKFKPDHVPPRASGNVFEDVPLDHWAAPWIEELHRSGITAGHRGRNFRPNDSCSRAEMAVFLVQTFNLASKK